MSLLSVYRDIDLPLLPCLVEMEVTGALIDIPRLRRLGERIGARKETLQQEIEGTKGGPINLNSPLQVAAFLYDEIGLPTAKITKKNPKGRSTDADALERLKGLHEVIAPLGEYKKLEKLDAAFVQVLPEKADSEGRIHPSFNNTRVETGRLSCSEPNLQQIPAGKKLKPDTPKFVREAIKEVRLSFIPRPGWTIVKYDQAAVEWRIIVCFAHEASEIEAINAGMDAHCATVADWTGMPYARVMELRAAGDKEVAIQREVAKTVKYGTGYGQGEEGLVEWFAAQGRPIRRDQAKVIREAIIKPAVWEWIESTKRKALALGYSETFHGRRIWNEDLWSPVQWKQAGALRSAVNAEVQGTAADIKKIADARIWQEKVRRKMKSRFILMVHDELVCECPNEEADDMREMMERIAPNIVQWQVPLSIETGSGPSWGECG
jgi:DNA polymerase-1